MVFYLQLLETGRTRDYILFAAAATLSICTKDQAYGLYLLAPFVIVEQLWRVKREAGAAARVAAALTDRRLVAAAITSGGLFVLCHNLLFNTDGFMAHLRFITGPGSEAYRVYPPTRGRPSGAAAHDGPSRRNLDGLAAVRRGCDRAGSWRSRRRACGA